MIRILIVEDQVILKDSLERLLGGEKDMEVAGTVNSAAQAFDLCRELKPDIVLMDVMTENGSNGIIAAAKIRRELPGIKIIIMTALPELTFVESAKKAGVHSFVYKSSDSQHLFYVIRSTMKGQGIYPGPRDDFSPSFTETEISVIRLVCQGHSRNEMAEKLAVSEGTVKAIITSILDKTGFDSIMKFAVYAVANGFIVPDV